jgi:hypothetical protein
VVLIFVNRYSRIKCTARAGRPENSKAFDEFFTVPLERKKINNLHQKAQPNGLL